MAPNRSSGRNELESKLRLIQHLMLGAIERKVTRKGFEAELATLVSSARSDAIYIRETDGKGELKAILKDSQKEAKRFLYERARNARVPPELFMEMMARYGRIISQLAEKPADAPTERASASRRINDDRELAAENELIRHLDTIREIQRRFTADRRKWIAYAVYKVGSTVVSHHFIPGLMVIDGITQATDYVQAQNAAKRILREYPELKKKYNKDAALAAIESTRTQFIVAEDPGRAPRRRHVRIRQHGSLFDADDMVDGQVDWHYKNLTAEKCYTSFIKGTNRVSRTSDGYEHYWYDPKYDI